MLRQCVLVCAGVTGKAVCVGVCWIPQWTLVSQEGSRCWCVLDTTVDVGVKGKAVCGGVCF